MDHHNAIHDVYNAPAPRSIKTSGYTPALADANSVIEMNSGSGTTVTIPPNSSVAFEIGTIIIVFRMGTGTVTIAPGAGVTLWSSDGVTTSRQLAGQYSEASVRKRDTNIWVVAGDLS
ncbi:MAG: hypothetical protein R3330_02840 [Saprospiraceae bacterium]|nr:hypothetical protein [Saprospiraceae bacterium]